MKPYIVRQILDEDGTVVANVNPTVVRQVISEETSKTVREIIETVVSSPTGTGKNASVAGYRVGGKTGTSEKVGQASDDYMVSFIGIAPMDDPQVAVLVILDSPDRTSGLNISGGWRTSCPIWGWRKPGAAPPSMWWCPMCAAPP